ncbi:MAG TPA: hypothetical protein VFT66_13325 [Roseiflexaceae bacterium]|nr:hypothetical protein [Roseiflexaceae bacterium]
MTDDQISRVRYYDQQILRTSDFVDEQAYHLAQRRRHNIGGHIWGIVSGLELDMDPEEGLIVQPGMAVDGYGRELILEQYQSIEPRAFDDKGSETLDIYLVYVQQTSDEAPPGYAACRPASQITSYRIQERAGLLIRKASGDRPKEAGIDLPERRQPDEVPPADLRFGPERVPPDAPSQQWPVFLGQVQRTGSQDEPYAITMSGRPYAGLRGELVRAPSGWAWLQVGEWEDNDYRFGVFLAEGNPAPASPPLAPDKPTLGITRQGSVELRADTTLWGDLVVEGGAVEFGPGPEYTMARPWRIYHALQEPDQDDATDITRAQLRIEMAGPGVDGKANEVVIGHWSDQKQDFVPCLTIAADDCKVTVHRNLVVNGKANGELSVLHQPPDAAPQAMAEQEDALLFSKLVERAARSPERLQALARRILTEPSLFAAIAKRGVTEPFHGEIAPEPPAPEAAPQPEATAESQVPDADLQHLARQLHESRDARRNFAALTEAVQEPLKQLWDATQALPEAALGPEGKPVDLQYLADQLVKNPDLRARFAARTTDLIRNSLRAFWRTRTMPDTPAPSGDAHNGS